MRLTYVIKRTSSYTLNTIWFLSNSLRFIFSLCWIYCKNKNKHHLTSNHETSYILWFQLHSWASINENYENWKVLRIRKFINNVPSNKVIISIRYCALTNIEFCGSTQQQNPRKLKINENNESTVYCIKEINLP